MATTIKYKVMMCNNCKYFRIKGEDLTCRDADKFSPYPYCTKHNMCLGNIYGFDSSACSQWHIYRVPRKQKIKEQRKNKKEITQGEMPF